jgi:hypothetical protein
MKVPTFEEAIVSKNIYDYELSRNCLGWQLSYVGENIATFISKDEAGKILHRMDEVDEDEAHDEQILLERENA